MRVLFLLVFLCASAVAQSKDASPTPLAIRAQAVEASGGATAVSGVRDYLATGTITYYWAGKEVSGPVAVRARGHKQARVEAVLPNGRRIWTVDGVVGSLKDSEQKISEMSYQTATNVASYAFPVADLAGFPADSTAQLFLDGITENSGSRQYRLRLEMASANPKKLKLKPSTYFVDSATFQIVKVARLSESSRSSTEEYLHEFIYSDYRSVNGVMFPFSIEERIAGQRVSTTRIESVVLNPGFSDADLKQ